MAFAQNGRACVHWSSVGKGPPLVLLMGLGCSSAMWFRLVPLLCRQFRVILLDNRGMGQTQISGNLVHRVTDMAHDVAAVLDAAGCGTAHVAGLSMGGMIAQEFALLHPKRLRSLTLMATNCGGSNAVLAPYEVWRLLFNKGGKTAEAALDLMRPHTYARGTHESVIEEDHVVRLANFPAKRDYEAQLYGLLGWSSYNRLPQIDCPVLVMHGQQDGLIPPANGRLLAQRITGARLVEIDQASHWLHSDQPVRVASELQELIQRVENLCAQS